MSCSVCGAPPLPLAGACVFCRSPLEADADATGLLDYLAQRLPAADVKRSGLLRRGPVKRLDTAAGRQAYRGRVRRDELELAPEMPPAEWVDSLIRSLSRDARSDHEVRTALTRAGWDLR